MNSSEPTPAANSGAWNYAVPNLEILYYQNLAIVPLGYLYLVESDSSQSGRWTIYVVAQGPTLGSRVLNLVQVQTYDTPLYWNYINWYLPGYNSSVQPLVTVANTAGLQTLSITQVPLGSSVKVLANGQGKWELYLRTGATNTASDWQRVGLEDGTIEFKEELWNYSAGNFGFGVEVFDAQYFDQYPAIETRQIIRAINEELFIGDLLIERNQALILMFQYIYSEFNSPYWLMKTSYIEVDHVIRGLEPFQLYQPDNQTFVLNYLQEVKPYHVQNLAFNLIYDGMDTWPGLPTDYDVPAYWNSSLEIPQFVSPILTPYTSSGSLIESTTSDAAANAQIWTEQPWSAWFNNYLLGIQGVEVANGGSGYTVPPEVVVTGTCVTPAVMTAVINGAGHVVAVNIVNPGSGYSTTAAITFVGGNGTGAIAVAQMGNNLVRSIKTTIKYDRYQYVSTILDWEPGVTYTTGTQVRWSNIVWSANSTVTGTVFIPDEWTRVVASTLSGVDRTMGFYVPGPNMPGLSLPLLIDGVDYPGVQVTAPRYNQNTGFGVGNFDINPYDNISYDASGRPTYDHNILDAEYSSSYLDPYLGTRATDINVDGGKYIDVYSSYAPEELVPGSEFDTLDMRVYTTPGADWKRRGHGFPEATYKFTFDPDNSTVSFANLKTYPVQITVANQTQGIALTLDYGYTVDWANQTITMIDNANPGDVIVITVFELGGGNQLYKQVYNGAAVGNTIDVPVAYDLLQEFAIFVNGVVLVQDVDYSYHSILAGRQTQIEFTSTYSSTDFISLVAIGPTVINSVTTNYSWSAPQTQVIVGDGTLSFTLDNSLIYNNPDSIVVTVDGARARTAGGVKWVGDGATTTYTVAQRLGFDQATVVDSDVRVYLNEVLQTSGYIVTPDTAGASVTFDTAPTDGQQILIYVLTNAQCYVDGNQLVFNSGAGLVPSVGSIIDVTTWNDPRQQGILTQCFVGPITQGITISEGYATTDFDAGRIANEPGSFDYTVGSTTTVNNIDLGTVITDPNRLLVALNGRQLFCNENFTVNGTQIVLTTGLLSATDVVMVTQFTNFVVPEPMAFRIFQDMRGVQATYRITPETTTTTTQPVLTTDDIIYVANAGALIEPDLTNNVWGVLTINAERIMYRYKDDEANTVSGLLRGTAGTALAAHESNAIVYNMGRGNLLSEKYQNYIVSDTTLANGLTNTFVANSIRLTYSNSENYSTLPFDIGVTTGQPGSYDYGEGDPTLEVEVYVGGIRLINGFTVSNSNPVQVILDDTPPAGVDVTILVKRGSTWYAPGTNTPSNGEPLQETNTPAARFLRGL